MHKGYDLYPSEYNFKYFTQLRSACSYEGKLQTSYAFTSYDFMGSQNDSIKRVKITIGVNIKEIKTTLLKGSSLVHENDSLKESK